MKASERFAHKLVMGKKQVKKTGQPGKASASSMLIDALPTVSHGVLAWMVKSRPEAGD